MRQPLEQMRASLFHLRLPIPVFPFLFSQESGWPGGDETGCCGWVLSQALARERSLATWGVDQPPAPAATHALNMPTPGPCTAQAPQTSLFILPQYGPSHCTHPYLAFPLVAAYLAPQLWPAPRSFWSSWQSWWRKPRLGKTHRCSLTVITA